MPGKIRALLDELIDARAKGNRTVAATTKTKLIIRGLNPDDYDDFSVDDPKVIAQIEDIATKMNISLRGSTS